MSRKVNRRQFIGQTGVAGAGFWVAARMNPAFAQDKNSKANFGCIGVGGRGAASVGGVAHENVVALCDADENSLNKQGDKFREAKKYTDYRKMLEQKDIEAVTVGTPDHNHAPAAAIALQLGKHVYCEKPLTHNIYEARKLTELAAKARVATQMGNQGHSSDQRRRLVEALQQGIIGNVTEVHAWTNRPIWPQGVDRPPGEDLVPKHLNWDAWIGPAPMRPYKERVYHPFAWRGWWDFGTAALGDMACHIMDASFWGLKLGYPTSVEAEGAPLKPETGPTWMTVKLEFPARGDMPPVKYVWYDGKKGNAPNLPPADLAPGLKLNPNGNVIVGDKGTIVVLDEQGGNARVIGKDGKSVDIKEIKVEQTLPRVKGGMGGHHQEWIDAVKGGPMCLGSFDYSGPFTEAVLIGIVAFRAQKKLDWDGPNMKARNAPEAEPFIKREYRKGFEV